MTERFDAADLRHAEAALAEARRGVGLASPNPAVGAVVVRDGEVIGRGHHVYARRDHAEVGALREAGDRSRGATLYVTLEPCSTPGRTPPCTERVLEAGVARVVACVTDPNPRHAGRGFEALAERGIVVQEGAARVEAVRLIAGYCQRIREGRPHVTVKLATTLDGQVATASGESQWITSTTAREHGQRLRHAADAILCGVGTVLADDPRLTCRLPEPTGSLLRCVIDPRARTPPTAHLFESETDFERNPVLVFVGEGADGAARSRLADAGAEVVEIPLADDAAHLDLRALLQHLATERTVQDLLVEGGGVTAGRFLGAGLVDRVVLHLAPKLLGGGGRPAFAGFEAPELAGARRLGPLAVTELGDDLCVSADVEGGFSAEATARDLAWKEA